MRHIPFLVFLVIMALVASCKRTYVCVCEAPAVDTLLLKTTEYRGLRKKEAEIEEENCESDPICTWDELL